MIGTSPVKNQRDAFQPLLTEFINPDEKLVLLADAIDWDYFRAEFEPLYSDTGASAMPIRFMVGCLLLKRLYGYGDESLPAVWVRDPYMQYFCGEAHFRHTFRCDPSDFVHFRKRIGKEGIQKIFAYSVGMHPQRSKCKQANSDTTVQENNTTFPTDAKLAKKVIDACNRIANAEGVAQRQSYVRVAKQLLRESYNGRHPRRAKKAKKARKKLRTLAGRLIRELERKLPKTVWASYKDELALYKKVIAQERTDKNKVYSLHKPFTACIAKGKAGKPYEFGNKIALLTHPTQHIVLAIKAFTGNPHDSKTIEPLLDQLGENSEPLPQEVIYDRGGRGKKTIKGVTITTPTPVSKTQPNKRRRLRRRFRRRAGIEAIISHLKSDHRMAQNYLHGKDSPEINAMLAAAAWNMKKWMERVTRTGKAFCRLLQKWSYYRFTNRLKLTF